MPMRRGWFLPPMLLAFAVDVTLTLHGQPKEYWLGNTGAVEEANPIGYILLVRSPWLFLFCAIVWMSVLSGTILFWRKPIAEWLAVVVAFAHAIGGCSWLIRSGDLGWLWGIVYLVIASQVSRWCWRRGGWVK